MKLNLHYVPHLNIKRGDFCANITNATLSLPAELKPTLEKVGIRTGEELQSYIDAFPSFFMAELGWSLQEVENAKVRLAAEIEKRMPVSTSSTPEVKFGARPPRR